MSNIGSVWNGCFCLECIREKEVGVVEDLGEWWLGVNFEEGRERRSRCQCPPFAGAELVACHHLVSHCYLHIL